MDASVDYGDFALGSSGTVDGFSSFSSGSRANTKDAADNDEFITLEVSVTGTADVTVGYTNNNTGNDLEIWQVMMLQSLIPTLPYRRY